MWPELWGRDLHETDRIRSGPRRSSLAAEELVRLAEPVLEAVLGPPAELVDGATWIDDAPLQLTRPGRHERRLEVRARDPLAQLEELDDRGLAPGAHVVDAALVLGGGQGRADDVADE